ENLEEITFLMDIKTKSVIYASTSAERLTGISVEKFYSNHYIWTQCILEEDKSRVIKGLMMENLLNHFSRFPSYVDDFRIIDCEGKLKWVRIKCMPIRDENNIPQRLVGIIQDTTNEKQDKIEIMRAKNKAEKLAMFDYLTRTYNRRAFFLRAREEYSRAKRQNKPVAVILTDLDKFKQVNDTYGHDVGDLVLKNFSRIIKNSIRKYDVVARFGGEEFVILLSGVDMQSAYKKAEQLRRQIETTAVYTKKLDNHIRYTASFGVAAINEVGKYSLEELISKADMALYKAKNNGRNRVEFV
ncbi:MAG: sensor domain-containing diguanylate cyclase, partial [Clostridiales bacterium]|nr:sensor domain-containing diguanylate cyclase [Clostridiales bacterium]